MLRGLGSFVPACYTVQHNPERMAAVALGQECVDLRLGHLGRMARTVEEDEAVPNSADALRFPPRRLRDFRKASPHVRLLGRPAVAPAEEASADPLPARRSTPWRRSQKQLPCVRLSQRR